jgi:hypothetical protein
VTLPSSASAGTNNPSFVSKDIQANMFHITCAEVLKFYWEHKNFIDCLKLSILVRWTKEECFFIAESALVCPKLPVNVGPNVDLEQGFLAYTSLIKGHRMSTPPFSLTVTLQATLNFWSG